MTDKFFEFLGEFDEFSRASFCSPLLFAYIGDAIFESYIRVSLLRDGFLNIGDIHKNSVKYVSAKAQSGFVQKILPILTNEELCIYKRGRNAKSRNPLNVKTSDYKRATGFEALIGFLFLKCDFERLLYILKFIKT